MKESTKLTLGHAIRVYYNEAARKVAKGVRAFQALEMLMMVKEQQEVSILKQVKEILVVTDENIVSITEIAGELDELLALGIINEDDQTAIKNSVTQAQKHVAKFEDIRAILMAIPSEAEPNNTEPAQQPEPETQEKHD